MHIYNVKEKVASFSPKRLLNIRIEANLHQLPSKRNDTRIYKSFNREIRKMQVVYESI